MSERSSIEWTDATWNPVRGCEKISPGCKHCYAERFAERFRGVPDHPFAHGFDPVLVPGKLHEPLRWATPRKVFVNSMSDLFQAAVSDAYIRRVVDVMLQANWHTYQVLTKRADRMSALLAGALRDAAGAEHIWWGVSVEDRRYGLPRVASLRAAPARTRFLSIEPLLEELGALDLVGIHWVIVGGESGPGARPLEGAWVRSLREQCARANVPFFFKQWGGKQKKQAGNMLDEQRHEAMPVTVHRPVPCKDERVAMLAQMIEASGDDLVVLRRARRTTRPAMPADVTALGPTDRVAELGRKVDDDARDDFASEEVRAAPEILFEMQLEERALGSHLGGRNGMVVRCPRCDRNACCIGRRRYAHELRLLRSTTWGRGADGRRIPVIDVKPEWRRVCVVREACEPLETPEGASQ